MKNLITTVAITLTVMIGAALFTLSEGSIVFALIILTITTIATISVSKTSNKKNTAK